ncbi:MAG TPA: peptidylprolyl isomerase, partial [Proteiniphilum sp.]|nr:peptidylprolyl isomerase [Proteiniphilum sp.]
MRYTLQILFFLVALASALPVMSQNNVIDEIVWVVGDEAILKSEVEE